MITSTFENVSDIGVCLGLSPRPPAVGGISEVIQDDIDGFVAEAAVPASLGWALERMWRHRDSLEEVGKLASISIRKVMPDDPVALFAEKLMRLASP